MTLEAQVGDVIVASIQTLLSNDSAGISCDFGTMVSGAVVNYLGAQGPTYKTNGPLYAPGSIYTTLAGSVRWTVVSGDLVSGKVTVRPFIRPDSAVARTVFTDAAGGLQLSVQNLGPMDPE